MLGVSYAMAENTFAVTQTAPGQPAPVMWVDEQALYTAGQVVEIDPGAERALAQVSCGPPILGTAVRVLADDGTPLPEGRVGEIAIRSDYMLAAYHRRPDLQPFVHGWYRSGDLGYVHGEEVYIVGRTKDLIISAGKNIFPQDSKLLVVKPPALPTGRSGWAGAIGKRIADRSISPGYRLLLIIKNVVYRHGEKNG